MTRFAFLSGLSRTGSTVLGTLLSQHPSLAPTGTSIVRHLMDYTRRFELGESPYFDITDPDSNLWGILRGILSGAYENETREIILEKDRGWVSEIDILRNVLGEEPRIITTVRSIPEIISSFVLLSRRNGALSQIDKEVHDANRPLNVWSLSRVIWEKYIYVDWKNLKTAFENNQGNLLLLDYDDIIHDAKKTIELICIYLDIPVFAPSTDNLVNPNPENDSVYGIKGLHTVHKKLERVSPPAWEVLGDECYEFWASKELEFWQGKNLEIGTDKHARS